MNDNPQKIESIEIVRSNKCDYAPFMLWLRNKYNCEVVFSPDCVERVNGKPNDELVDNELFIFLGNGDSNEKLEPLIIDNKTEIIGETEEGGFIDNLSYLVENENGCYGCDNYKFCSFVRDLVGVVTNHMDMVKPEKTTSLIVSPLLKTIQDNCVYFRELKIINEEKGENW